MASSEFDRLIEHRNYANFSIEVGKEVWEAITRDYARYQAENGRLIRAIQKNCEETDYCILCDNHPSDGHGKDCIIGER